MVLPLAGLFVCYWALTKARSHAEAFTRINNPPIVFYGKLEDESGNPLKNVTVNFSIHFSGFIEDTIKTNHVVSDANGLFEILGYNGERLSVIPMKKGYALASLNGGGVYSLFYPEGERIHPNPDNPVVIEMRKLQVAEPLMSINQRYRLHYTNAPIYFDLLAGKIVPDGGDLKITVQRPQGLVSGLTHPDWSVHIESVDGGLLKTSAAEASVTYAAPAAGYRPDVVFIFSTNAPYRWSEYFEQEFFVVCRSGKIHAKLNFSFGINEYPDGFMNLIFDGIANTNNSHNWEATTTQQ